MNREQNKKLLKHTGLAVLKRPDGGVVTQRTANPLPTADCRDSSHNSLSVPRISFQELTDGSANAPSPRQCRPKAWYRETKAALIDRDGDLCWICETPTTDGDRTIDHVDPVSRGGGDELDNLKLAHADCNRRRGNADIHTALLKKAVVRGIAKRRAAQADRNPQGHDPAEGHGRNDESPVAAGDAPHTKSIGEHHDRD